MKKRKLTKAQREAEANWEKLNSKWDKIPKFSSVKCAVVDKDFSYQLTSPRETEKIPSLSTPGGSASKVTPLRYTGDKVLGIAQMSKSNAVPVFAQQEAIDIARMRRN